MSLNQQLDTLFEEWSKEKCFRKGNFFKDGIINETLYNKQTKKLLFIAKEPNKANHKGSEKDFREEWKKGIPDYRIAKQIAEWSNGIFNNFPRLQSLKQDKSVLEKIAFINVKKTPGGGVTNKKDIDKYFELENNLRNLKKQIDIIAPNMIILGLRDLGIKERIFGALEWKETGYSVNYAKFKQATVIDFYHPSSRIPPNASYCLLEKIINITENATK